MADDRINPMPIKKRYCKINATGINIHELEIFTPKIIMAVKKMEKLTHCVKSVERLIDNTNIKGEVVVFFKMLACSTKTVVERLIASWVPSHGNSPLKSRYE